MKFVHIADMHFDSAFVNLSDKEAMGDLRRLEQRKVFKKVIDYIKENDIEYLFISGDLYEQNYIKKSTIEYINNLFVEIPNTQIYIAPGNHDPYIKNSYYQKYTWNYNVHIFDSNLKKIETEEVDIYGFGFDDFYCSNCGIENINIQNPEKLNVLLLHATLDGANLEDRQYNSISKKILEEKGFDYIALGHIHKSNYSVSLNQRIIYPGSTISLGFDEIGKHGMIVGNLEKNNLKLKFLALDESEFIEINLDVTEIISKEELIEKINDLKIENNQFAKIILIGKRNFEINTYDLYKLILNDRIIKIKNKTKINYNLEKMANDNTLKGLFAKKMMIELNNTNLTNDNIEIIEKAIEIGFESLE